MKIKAYHVTWDESIEMGDPWEIGLLKDSKLVAEGLPYLFVHEIGVTGKDHFHGYFHSTFCKNTIKTKLQGLFKVNVYFSNPENPKYLKYNRDGVLGVEIYLLKGNLNHMKSNDDLKVLPSLVWLNKEYYGLDIKQGRLAHIRGIYEKVITEMKNYKGTVAKITQERKKSELQLCLKDLEIGQGETPMCIRNYLAYTHYMRKEYNFTENGYKNLYRKILKEKFPNIYKDQIRQRMDEIN